MIVTAMLVYAMVHGMYEPTGDMTIGCGLFDVAMAMVIFG